MFLAMRVFTADITLAACMEENLEIFEVFQKSLEYLSLYLSLSLSIFVFFRLYLRNGDF